MYNLSTEKAIRNIPAIVGIDRERLPQLLTKKYARIISLKTRYEEGKLKFNNEELKSDYQELNTIANTLELYLIADKTDSTKEKESIAYVAAVSRKLMSMILRDGNLDNLSLYFVPEDLLSAILFIISGNLPDAQEVADGFDIDNIVDPYKKWLYIAIQMLIRGSLNTVIEIRLKELDRHIDIWEYATQLVWRELFYGIQHLCGKLLNGREYQNEEFLKIERLSYESLDYDHHKDIYEGAILLSKLLHQAADQLCSHALIDTPAPLGISSDDKNWKEAIRRQAGVRPYLWDNHIEGINKGILNHGVSSIITFPTGAGKTTLSELKIVSTLLYGKRIVYLVPTHALENQVNYNLKKLVDRVVPSIINVDGEFALFDDENEQQIMVMTPEHCLTVIRTTPEKLQNVGLVVFDEFHLIHGDATDTRAVDSMILLTMLFDLLPSADYFLISAMVKNGQEIAEWIQSRTHRECILLDNPWKPTSQLQGCLIYNKTAIDNLVNDINQTKKIKKNKTPPAALKKRMVVQPMCLFSLKAIWDTMEVPNYYPTNILDQAINLSVGCSQHGGWYLSSNFNTVASELAMKFSAINQKTIVFALSPGYANNICDQVCKNAAENKENLFSKRNDEIQNISLELGGFGNSYLSICKYATLHHSHLLPEERILSEWYFKQKDGAMVMVATPTIAQGINLPADVVLIAGSSRYDQQTQGQERIEAHEILNAAGRAGRAGFRSHGTAILIPSKIIQMENNSINSIWVELREEVFSKGDRCLVVNDPISNILTGAVEGEKDNVFHGSKESIAKHLHNSLFAYQMQKKGEEEVFQKMLDNFINNLPLKENVSIEQSVAEKTSIDENTVRLLFECISDDLIPNIVAMTAIDLLHNIRTILSANPGIFSKLFHNKFVEEQAKKLVGLPDDEEWTADDIEKLCRLIEMYISGYNYEEIESSCNCKKKTFVDNARIFVLRVIPEISYMCGVYVQVVLAKIDALGAALEISKDFKSFASCIKEGVLNYDMLMAKYKNKWMRVECHKNYYHP